MEVYNHIQEDDNDDYENDYVFLTPPDCKSMATVIGILILFLATIAACTWKLWSMLNEY